MKLVLLCICLFGVISAAEHKVLALSGSIRAGSENKKLAAAAIAMAREMGATATLAELRDYPMPIYDGDLESEKGMPEQARRLRTLFLDHDVIIIVAPEYNGSIPGGLKNGIDWLSRTSDGKPSYEAFKGKKFILMSYSGSASGGAGALSHLRAILERVGGVVATTQVNVASSRNITADQERLKTDKIKAALQEVL